MVVREDFINQHPDVIKAFIEGWLDGTAEAKRNSDLVVKLFMENESLYKDLGPDLTRRELDNVKWADLGENNLMFGLDGGSALFSSIFRQAGQAWVRRGYIRQTVDPSQAKEDRFLRKIYRDHPVARVAKEHPVMPIPRSQCDAAVMTESINVQFAAGSADLDPNARKILDGVSVPQTFSNVHFCVEGNTDNAGSPTDNIFLSERRAKAVVDYFVKHYDRDIRRFTAFGNGPYRPIASNATEKGRAQNRRTDIKIVTDR
jgi:outer membrane protein OmpA-like peptidoglycan-associated protein